MLIAEIKNDGFGQSFVMTRRFLPINSSPMRIPTLILGPLDFSKFMPTSPVPTPVMAVQPVQINNPPLPSISIPPIQQPTSPPLPVNIPTLIKVVYARKI